MVSYIQYLVLALLTVLRSLVRNPGNREKLRDVMLRLRDAITLIYEPEQLQGVARRKADINAFLNRSVEVHTASMITSRYKPGSFDIDADDGDDNKPQAADATAA